MDSIYVEVAGSVARWLMQMIAGYMVEHHIINGVEGESLAAHVVPHLAIGLLMVGSLGWSIAQKFKQRHKLDLAIGGLETAINANQKLQQTAGV